jgi:hypothetical protein
MNSRKDWRHCCIFLGFLGNICRGGVPAANYSHSIFFSLFLILMTIIVGTWPLKPDECLFKLKKDKNNNREKTASTVINFEFSKNKPSGRLIQLLNLSIEFCSLKRWLSIFTVTVPLVLPKGKNKYLIV